ncbi:hypothetical protein AB1K62_14535 [Parasphingorhabdus sp. JC815]|uniref:hypothetical protein n=1 Tax=Parasphingorhabdus sp. JC815 TaxID=3232140 RepID=UPI0034595232
MSDKPTWGYKRADELRKEEIIAFTPFEQLKTAFAKYIEQQEEKPVDPLLIEAREIVAVEYEKAGHPMAAAAYRSGVYDNDMDLKTAYAALKSREPQS